MTLEHKQQEQSYDEYQNLAVLYFGLILHHLSEP